MNFSSKLIEDAVNAFAQLPGIGKRTALRLVLYLLKQDIKTSDDFGDTIKKMRSEINFCTECNNVSDQPVCSICSDNRRDNSTLCVVEDFKDIITLENVNQYNGLYHVLGGIISPIDGIGPGDLSITQLIKRASTGDIKEIIMALSPTIEGDTTVFYISKQLKEFDIKITTVARGISFGSELQYADELTLARSIVNRLPFDNYFVKKEN
ncbi:MAG: recombination protein RecR [Bacteroidetes bacterium]|nr:recombination protein RecR [Bacteroidota bacterium]